MPKVEGITALKAKLKRLAAKHGRPSVAVGYTANYAIHVHENLEMTLRGQPRPRGRGNYWDPPGRGQSKFLEQPARDLGPELRRMITRGLIRGLPLGKALYIAGLRLQRASQELVPVDTGNLKASAYTILEDE